VLKLSEKIACWRCTGLEGKPLPCRVQLRDRSGQIERQRLDGGPARARPRPGRRLDRRRRLEQALRRALIADRSWVKGATDALAVEGADGTGKLP